MSWPEVVVTIVAAIWTLVMVHMRYQARIDAIRATSPIASHMASSGLWHCACGYALDGQDMQDRAHEWHQHLTRVARNQGEVDS